MQDIKKLARRIEIIFAASEGTYWIGFCAISGFIAAFLSHRGLTDTQIGLTTSLGSLLAITLQLFLSNVLDNHPELPIKKLISVLFVIGIAAAALVGYVPLPAAMMILMFAIVYAMGLSNSGYLNAQLVQFNNKGIPARYGWPRGVGSFCYACSAYIYGRLVEKYNPDILIPSFIIGTAVCVICVLMMPNPNAGQTRSELQKEKHVTSYREMITGNRTLVVLLICTLMNGIGNMAGYTFILRVVERVGGSMTQYGLSEFIRAAAEVPALFASGWLLKKYKAGSLLTVSYLFFGFRLLILASAHSIWAIYVASALNMVCVGFSTFSSVIFVNSIVRDTEKVRGQSLCSLCGSIGSIIGSAYAGIMIDRVGLNAMLLMSAAFCISAFAGMLLFCKPDRISER